MNSCKLSVIVIVRNEERDLPACLDSVKELADEIIVVDSGSTDKTVDIAKSYTDHVFFHEWLGYSGQKQYAMEQSHGEWVLNIDADERVSLELARQIKAIVQQDEGRFNGFKIPFQTYVFGKRLRFGGLGGETHIRLFRRGCAAYGPEKVHEGIRVKPPIGRLTGAIEHFTYHDVSDYLNKCNMYTSLIAEKKYKQGFRFHWWHHIRWFYEFFVRYGLKAGFLDGSTGYAYALLSSTYAWIKFYKLNDIQNEK